MQQAPVTQQEAVAWGLCKMSRPVHPPISPCSGASLTSPGGHYSQGKALCSWVETQAKAWTAGGLWPKHEFGWWGSFHLSVKSWSRFNRLGARPSGGTPRD